jgi:cytochrome b pre-mRNA-processing protein 3
LRRELTETFAADLDASMREMTFGDLAVPREVKRATAALYDRYVAYGDALRNVADNALTSAIHSQLDYLGAMPMDVQNVAAYMRSVQSHLQAQSAARLMAGHLDWPNPDVATRRT